ncbi:hypothetical protein [Lysobacter sp. Root604]|uniref:hypothetical protein n=1 Tax=Lysobacter sp. Root604 TaxID=1736568 RepID=UPI0012FC3820|nr:hypothetical protein [Lysobacter sp. Root604]
MPTPSTHDYADGHVIHLLPRLETASSLERAPEALRLPRRMSVAGRRSFALMNAIASAGAAWALHLLWTSDTPGAWFNLIFTVMIGGLTAALWALLIASIRQAKHEARLQAAWRAMGPNAIATTGRVSERRWTLAEDGAVASFALVVQIPGDRPISGQWHPEHSREHLLQTQVPGVGAQARVWCAPNALGDTPRVIEVADPSVVA